PCVAGRSRWALSGGVARGAQGFAPTRPGAPPAVVFVCPGMLNARRTGSPAGPALPSRLSADPLTGAVAAAGPLVDLSHVTQRLAHERPTLLAASVRPPRRPRTASATARS